MRELLVFTLINNLTNFIQLRRIIT